MRKHFLLIALLSIISIPVFGAQMTGYISDQQCANSGSKAAKATDWINADAFEACAQKCVKNGSPMVFVTEDNKVLQLDAKSTKKARAHVGHRVSVNGTVENGVLKIDKISSIPMEGR